MTSILIAMVVILGIAGLVLFYAAYPSRGRAPQSGEWLGEVMRNASDALPTLDETDGDPAVRRRPEEPGRPI